MAMTLISFLGTSDYAPVRYSLDGRLTDQTPYIQAALAQLYHDDLRSGGASVRVFMTAEARQRHWEAARSLRTELHTLLALTSIEPVMIPRLNDEKELWTIFDQVYRSVPEEGEILLDITHGFRSIPLLGSVILDYARSLKHIKVRAIHYGAIEARQDDIVPIVDLSRLDRLFRWNRSVELFVRHGDASGLEGLVGETSRYANSEERSGIALTAQKRLTASLRQCHQLLATVRGDEILAGEPFVHALSALDELSAVGGFAVPLLPLYGLIRTRVSGFRQGNPANLLYAIALCIDYGLIQQGITLLQESIITILLMKHGLDFRGRNPRDAVSRYFAFITSSREDYTDPIDDEKYRYTVTVIVGDPLCNPLAIAFDSVRDLRNNINHAGFTASPPKPERFRQALKKQFAALLAVLAEEEGLADACSTLAARKEQQ